MTARPVRKRRPPCAVGAEGTAVMLYVGRKRYHLGGGRTCAELRREVRALARALRIPVKALP